MRIGNQKDFAAGLLYLGLGIPVAVMSTQYRMGTAAQMGPGYFPFWMGVILAVIGAVVLLGSLRVKDEAQRLGFWDLKSLAIILASVVLFGILLPTMGLVVALAALVLVSSLASHEFGWAAALLNVVILLALTLVIFVYALSLQLPVWPPILAS